MEHIFGVLILAITTNSYLVFAEDINQLKLSATHPVVTLVDKDFSSYTFEVTKPKQFLSCITCGMICSQQANCTGLSYNQNHQTSTATCKTVENPGTLIPVTGTIVYLTMNRGEWINAFKYNHSFQITLLYLYTETNLNFYSGGCTWLLLFNNPMPHKCNMLFRKMLLPGWNRSIRRQFIMQQR